MDCRIVQNSLSGYVDGQLLDKEAKLIEGHLGECMRCNVVSLDLSEIRSAARELPLHTPQRALWARIQQTIEADEVRDAGVAGKPEIEEPTNRIARWWMEMKSRRFTFSLPQMAGAGALAMLLVGVSIFSAYRQGAGQPGIVSRPTEAATELIAGESSIRERIKLLTSSVIPQKASWDPTLQSALDRNLARISQSLEECRQKLRENPHDKEHQQMLRDLYKQQIELLEDFDKLK